MTQTTFTEKSVYIFDLDGTLARSKMAITESMAALLRNILMTKKIAIISGGNFPQFKTQVLDILEQGVELETVQNLFKNLYILPTSGTRMYIYDESSVWKGVYAENLTQEEQEKIMHAFDIVLQDIQKEAPFVMPENIYGNQIEIRDSQITFSGLGQLAPLEEKKVWDTDMSKRKYMQDRLIHLLPEFSVAIGGSTSIDIVHKGIDKAYGVQKLSTYLNIPISEMCFIGDALYEGGNDAAVKKTGIETVQVKDELETEELLKLV